MISYEVIWKSDISLILPLNHALCCFVYLKLLFPIWAPLEFMYIVRFYKKKWGVMDFVPTPQSILEYTDSYSQASDIEVLSLSTEPNHVNSGGTNIDDDDSNDEDDRNDRGSGPSAANGKAGSGDKGSWRDQSNHQNTRLIVHTCSSGAHLMGLIMQQMRDRIARREAMEWNRMLSVYRYGTSRVCQRVACCSRMMLSGLYK